MGRIASWLLFLATILPGLMGAGDKPAGQVTPDDTVTSNIYEIERHGHVGMPAHDRPGEVDVLYENPTDKDFRLPLLSEDINLDSVISLVSQDSLYAYTVQLLALGKRVAGTGGARVAAQWLVQKVASFGYDSIVCDSFYGRVDPLLGGQIIFCRNVQAYKQGNLYPREHIALGAHYDAVPGSPGADDNGSSVVAVLEMARILKNLDMKTGFTFVFYDGEEADGLGEKRFLEQAVKAREKIPYINELDMISFFANDSIAYVGYGENDLYAQTWAHLADSLPGIGLAAVLGSGWFEVYEMLWLTEATFSLEYWHTYRDDISTMNFDYLTRMAKATLATAYYSAETFTPAPDLIESWPQGAPTIINPGTSPSLQVYIDEYGGAQVLPGSVQMWYSINDAPEESVPMTSMGGGIYEAPFPPLVCHDRIDYYITTADLTTGKLYRFPAVPFKAAVATSITVCFEDDFEQDLGWTTGGDATLGTWMRYPAKYNGFYPKQDYDGSGRCYVTDRYASNDVNGGTASLFSPWLDVSRGEAVIEYAYWFWTQPYWYGYGPAPDQFAVYIDNGSEVVAMDKIIGGPDTTGDWHTKSFWLGEYLHGDSLVRVRFDASDFGLDSKVEAALDAVKIVLYSVRPAILTDALPFGEVGIPYSQQLEAVACAEPLTWSDKNGNLAGTGLTLTSEGYVTGQPTDTETITFTAQVTDADGVTGEKQYAIDVNIPYICGDANRDGGVNVGDIVFVIAYIFKGGAAPDPLDIADAGGDGAVNVADAVYLINHIFKAGPSPLCQ